MPILTRQKTIHLSLCKVLLRDDPFRLVEMLSSRISLSRSFLAMLVAALVLAVIRPFFPPVRDANAVGQLIRGLNLCNTTQIASALAIVDRYQLSERAACHIETYLDSELPDLPRAYAVLALGALRCERSMPRLLAASHSESACIRIAAAFALRQFLPVDARAGQTLDGLILHDTCREVIVAAGSDRALTSGNAPDERFWRYHVALGSAIRLDASIDNKSTEERFMMGAEFIRQHDRAVFKTGR
jgi:hypothetical protein